MKSSDRMVLMILPLVAAMAAFWMLVLSPKREEAGNLGTQVTELQKKVDEAKAVAAEAAMAKARYRDHYQAIVGLGKAVPADDDTATLYVQLSRLSKKAKVDLRSIQLKQTGGSAPPTPAPAPAPKEGDKPAGEGAAAAPATEATAAMLPLGASIGPAGFGVMPYQVKFRGDFFHIADFLGGVDRLVRTGDPQLSVRGRLLTVDGFSLKQDDAKGFPRLSATFALTTYLTPPGQGLTAGASPAGPVPAGSGGTPPGAPASATTEAGR